jgi:hypothetical protein
MVKAFAFTYLKLIEKNTIFYFAYQSMQWRRQTTDGIHLQNVAVPTKNI